MTECSVVCGKQKRPVRGVFIDYLAEAVRFELTNGFPLPVFKTGAIDHSATLPVRVWSSRHILTSSRPAGFGQEKGLQIAQKIKAFICGFDEAKIVSKQAFVLRKLQLFINGRNRHAASFAEGT